MRYHYEKPDIYLSMYGKVYFCDHPVYHCCTLFQIGEKGLAGCLFHEEENISPTLGELFSGKLMACCIRT